MNGNACYICGDHNSMLNDNWIPQLDGTNAHYHDGCLKAQNEMLATYGNINVGQHMVWRDADENQHEGSILCIAAESDGCGHFLTLRNGKGGVDDVPMSLIEGYYSHGELMSFADGTCIDNKVTHRMILACANSQGEPDFAFVKVKCTSKDCDEYEDKSRAIKWAEENDYEAPFVVFNCTVDSAGKAIEENFKWETASVVEV